ncbi:MAG: bifunctional hydroxymethylpyrimidine kinase/phosphomethylpyrimidine kinase [Rhodospirillales bacterium]|nr:bifunctional hydroxymethylpyrimidine kinase/phosphomethylpyrimidine kinase [Rhodospirillales bacterium]
MNRARVLIVAGSDSGGGAGIQADIKTVTALGGFAMTAITALTAQNTLGVSGICPVEPSFIRQQMAACLEDLGADAIKTGMLHSVEVIEAVAAELDMRASNLPLIADPVMVAQSGASLIQDAAVAAILSLIVPRAALLTPNTPEAARLTGLKVEDRKGQIAAAERLTASGAKAVLVKGGHLGGDPLFDVLLTEAGLLELSTPRVATEETHGTGCTLASAIATGVAQGLALDTAVRRAQSYLHRALETAPGFGQGQGPVNHGHPLQSG